MKKRILPLLLTAALMMTVLGGCGDDPNAIHFALLTGAEGTGDPAAAALAEGIEAVSTQRTWSTRNYQAAAEDETSYKEAFASASKDGVYYVVSQGEAMEVPVYAAQNAHHGTKYILFDGAPRSEVGAEAEIRKNTMSVTFDKPTMGFLAGYAAVREGMRNVAFMTGSADASSVAFFTGFVNGVGHAVQTLGLGADAVTVGREYAGSSELNPMRMADALKLYKNGTELIVTDEENIATAVMQAAAADGTYMATVGFDVTGSSDSVLFSVVPDYSGAIESLIAEITDSKGFKGGKTVALGAKESGITLTSTFAGFKVYTATDTDTVLTELKSGSAVAYQDTGDADTDSTSEMLTFGAQRGLTDAGKSVMITDIQPVVADAQTGIGVTDLTTTSDVSSVAEIPVEEGDSSSEDAS